MLTGRQLYLELFDERGNVLVGDNGTLVFLDTENALVDMNFLITLDLTLTTQTPAILDLLTGEMWFLRVEDLTPTLKNLDLTLSAGSLTTTGRRQEHTILVEGRHQTVTLCHRNGTVAINLNIHVT